MRKIATIVVLVFGAACHPVWADGPAKVRAEPTSTFEAERQLLIEGRKRVIDNDKKGARELLQAAVDAPDFSKFSEEVQHDAYYLLGATAEDLGANETALTYAQKAAAMDQATGLDWTVVLNAANAQNDAATEADAVITIARRWPTTLDQYRDRYYEDLCLRLKNKDPKRRTALLKALAGANWRPADVIDNTSPIWLWLTQVLLEADDIPGARAAAEKIRSDHDVIVMQSDKLFDPVTSANPDRFDPLRTAKSELNDLTKASAAAPDHIKGPFLIAVQLMTLERNDEALALMDRTLKIASPTDGSKSPYSDTNDYLIWVMDTRSRLLKRLGRYDEAVAQERKVAQFAENGGLNVSQLLNLANLLVAVGRSKEAFDLLQDADARSMSPYGRMVLMSVRGCAAEQLHNYAEAEKSLNYLRLHGPDNVGALTDGLVCAGDLDGMAKVMVQELNDPAQRDSVLMEFQNFDPPTGVTPQERLWKQRFKAVGKTDEVQAAIQAFGRIHKYSMNAPLD